MHHDPENGSFTRCAQFCEEGAEAVLQQQQQEYEEGHGYQAPQCTAGAAEQAHRRFATHGAQFAQVCIEPFELRATIQVGPSFDPIEERIALTGELLLQ